MDKHITLTQGSGPQLGASTQLLQCFPVTIGCSEGMSQSCAVLSPCCCRPDKVLPAVRTFVQKYLGQKYVQPPPFDLHACYADSSATRPLIFVLSAGSDPTAALLQFATEKGMASRLRTISLGQGQGPKAAALIASASAAGEWVALQVRLPSRPCRLVHS